jgi:chromosome partitioning protein
MIYAIGGEKGGTGKTTVGTCVAPLIDDLIVVDTDVQSSFSNWAALRMQKIKDKKLNVKPIRCVQKFGENLADDVQDLSKRYDNVLIDVAGKDTTELREALLVCDKIIFTIQATQFDVWTLPKIQKMTKDAKRFNKKLKAYYLLTQCPTNTKEEKEEARELLSDVKEIKLLDSLTHIRKSYRKAPGLGVSVLEYDPVDEKAREEIRNIFEEVFK